MTQNLPPQMGFISKAITVLASGVLAFVLLTRFAVLAGLPDSSFVNEWFASDLFFHFHHAVDVWFLWIAFDLPLLIGLPLFLLLFRKRLLIMHRGRLELSGPATAMAWLLLASHHFLLDIQPMLTATFALLFFVLPNPFRNNVRPPITVGVAATVGLSAFVLFAEPNTSIAIFSTISYIGIFTLSILMPLRMHSRIQWVTAAGLIGALQLAQSLVPLMQTPDLARKLDTHRAYSFCEAKQSGSVYAAVTACYLHDSRYLVSEDCKQEHVAEFSANTLQLTKRHVLSTPDYYGRMEFVRCIDDTLYVGGSDITQGGENLLDSALSMQMQDSSIIHRNLVPAGVGHRSAYDPKRDALYFSGEFKDTIIRLDRASGQQDPSVANWYNHPMLVLFAFPIQGSLAFAPNSHHPARDALFAGEVFSDSAFEFSLEDHSLIQKYQSTGGIIELTVDPEADRLYLANMWGMDVWDLKTGDRIKRMRLGTVNRHPIVDVRHELIYVPSTVTGRLFILDRQTLEVMGSITTGYGPRYGLLTQEGQLILSSNSGTYAFDTKAIASQFKQHKGQP